MLDDDEEDGQTLTVGIITFFLLQRTNLRVMRRMDHEPYNDG